MAFKNFTSICAAGLLSAFMVGAASASTLMVNGDFEDTSITDLGLVHRQKLADLASAPDSSWDVYKEIPGWKTDDGAGIEVQTNRTLTSIDAHSGQHYIELDSHPSPESNSSMKQEITLDIGKYKLSFWYSPRNGDVDSNGIEYSVFGASDDNGVPTVLPTVGLTGPSSDNGTSVGEWTEFTSIFTVASGDSPVTLLFAATG